MEHSLLLTGLIGCSLGLSAQNVQPPPAVAEDLRTRYPGMEVKDRDSTKDGGYKAEFDDANDREHEVFYSAEGQWSWTDHDVKRAEVPQAVWDTLAKTEYAGWTVDKKERVQTPQHKEMYEIKLEKRKQQDVYLYFLPDGTRTTAPARK